MLKRLAIVALCCSLWVACDDDDKKTNGGEDTVECTPGSLDCTCAEGNTCDAGLVCGDTGVCETETGTPSGLTIATAEARACELLFEQQGATIASVTYGADTHGALRRREPNVAIAVSRGSDTPFAEDSVTLVVEGDVAELSLRSARCFDASGAELTDADVTLQ